MSLDPRCRISIWIEAPILVITYSGFVFRLLLFVTLHAAIDCILIKRKDCSPGSCKIRIHLSVKSNMTHLLSEI